MNKENEDADAGDRQDDAARDRQTRNEPALLASTYGSQYDQAIDENAGEDAKHDLGDAITHEVA